MKRRRKILIVVAALLFFFGLFLLQKNFSELKNFLKTPISQNQKDESVKNGVGWLIAQEGRVSTRTYVAYLMQIYKTTNDKTLALKLSTIINEKGKGIPQGDTNIDINDKKHLDLRILRPVVQDLLRRKCLDKEYRADAQIVKKFIDINRDEMFSREIDLSQKIVFFYLIKELGIDTNNLYQSVISEIRSKDSLLSDPTGKDYNPYLYALTHIIFTESDYYGKYLDRNKYKKELEGLDKAIDVFMKEEEISPFRADILSEILLSKKLLGINSDQKMKKLHERLISLQNSDGSWGDKSEPDGVRIHHTVVAILALMEFSPELRGGKIYCSATP